MSEARRRELDQVRNDQLFETLYSKYFIVNKERDQLRMFFYSQIFAFLKKITTIEPSFIFTDARMPQPKNCSWTQKLKQLIHIPVSIRWVSLSLFLFMMGWGLGGDTFFSIYIKEIIGTGIGLTLIGTLLPIIKLLIVIPI